MLPEDHEELHELYILLHLKVEQMRYKAVDCRIYLCSYIMFFFFCTCSLLYIFFFYHSPFYTYPHLSASTLSMQL